MSKTEPGEKDSPLINLAALYATLILIIGTILSEWPPEGQKEWFPTWVNDSLFVILAAATILIILRVLKLIWNTDPFFKQDLPHPTHLTWANILRAALIASPAIVSFVSGYSVSDSVIILILSVLAAVVYLYQSYKTNRALQEAEKKIDQLKFYNGELAWEDEEGNISKI